MMKTNTLFSSLAIALLIMSAGCSGFVGENGLTEQTATVTPEPQETPTVSESSTPRETSIPERNFSEQNISLHIRQLLNEERKTAGLPQFDSGKQAEETLTEMATNHSQQMAQEGHIIHTIDGVTSQDRYERNELYNRCKYESANGDHTLAPDQETFEVIGKTVAGQTYEETGENRSNVTDREIAKKIVDDWMSRSDYRKRLTLRHASIIGIGVEITANGDVYVTANLCSPETANPELTKAEKFEKFDDNIRYLYRASNRSGDLKETKAFPENDTYHLTVEMRDTTNRTKTVNDRSDPLWKYHAIVEDYNNNDNHLPERDHTYIPDRFNITFVTEDGEVFETYYIKYTWVWQYTTGEWSMRVLLGKYGSTVEEGPGYHDEWK